MRVPRKNISSRITDVKPPPERQKPPSPAWPELEETGLPATSRPAKLFPESAKNKPETILFAFLAAIALGGILIATVWFFNPPDAVRRADSSLERLENIFSFSADTSGDYPADSAAAQSAARQTVRDLWEKIKENFRILGSRYREVKTVAVKTPALLAKVSFLEKNWLELAMSGRGAEIIAKLEEINADLDALLQSSGNMSGERQLFAVSVDLRRIKDFLDNLISWLREPETRYLAVFLQNPSEIRPSGGFLGSYVELAIRGGNLEKITVRDVNEADREMKAKIVPPLELQMLVTRWRAADANWFFDFSMSAQKTLELLEASDLYKNQNIRFDGALAVSEKILGDILRLTGPVNLPKSKITLNPDNFLTEMQKSVQAGQAAGDREPKKALKELVPLLLQKIREMPPEQKTGLTALAADWFAKKDAMAYLDNPKLQNLFDAYAWSGKVFILPGKFNGDYLALVNANVDGAKTDLVIKQTSTLESRIDADGTIRNRLTIVRKNAGNTRKEWWYNAVNRNYLKIFTPPAAQVENAAGFWERKIYPQVNYEKSGYTRDSLLAAVEATAKNPALFPYLARSEESGKTVFGMWTRAEPGASSRVVLEYKNRLFAAPAEGGEYQFVFEKQAGARGSYVFEISAPPGFVFKENNLPIYQYQSDDPPGRLVIDLTFVRIQ